jgi:ADP-heptose:LPS heptosyltransferase
VREQGRGPSIGDRRPRFADVHRIAVLRGSGLGDLVQALPAVEALAAAYPGASITLLGTPAHVALLEGRPSPFTSLEVLPLRPGVRDGGPEDPAATVAFLERMRGRGFDLAVQLHGGGRNSNPFLLELGARHTVGTRTEDAAPLERTLPYLYYQHEVMRTLEVVGLAGAVPVELEPRLRLRPDEAAQLRPHRSDAPLVALHPGATDPRRRWPASAFAAVASALAADGARVVVVGDRSDVPVATEILARVSDPGGLVSSRAGAQSLPELVATLLASDVVLANDSGPRHLAAALGTRTAGIYWVGNVVNAGPLGRSRDRVQIAFTTACPVCGVDITQVGWTAERCEHDVSIVADVPPGAVLADVRSLLGDAAHQARGPAAVAQPGGRDGPVG